MNITMRMRSERRFIRPTGSSLHIDFHIHVDHVPTKTTVDREPLTLAVVLDRSGSMQGEKIATAKRAALSVLDRLEERDQVAVVVFDDKIDVVHSTAPVTATVKANIRKALEPIQARANTALHEGWLTGCKAIASDSLPKRGLARCFLLTDGIANVGITDPEQIASEAAGIREHAGIGTSTFGIGADYNESLLGPMAVAGGGQFHHLRTASEIATTFIGELGDLLTVAASHVRLEFEVDTRITANVVSAYWARSTETHAFRQSIDIGDLQSDEERHVVVRFDFPAQENRDGHVIRARLTWVADGKEQSNDWQEAWFSYASPQTCENEPHDPGVMHWVALNEADHARREALKLSQQGNLQEARAQLKRATHYVLANAGSDKELQAEAAALSSLDEEMAKAPLPSPKAKEVWYQSQNRSRSQKDYRK